MMKGRLGLNRRAAMLGSICTATTAATVWFASGSLADELDPSTSSLDSIAAEVAEYETKAGVKGAGLPGPADGPAGNEPDFNDLQRRLLELIDRRASRGPADGPSSCPTRPSGPADGGRPMQTPEDTLRKLARLEVPIRSSFSEVPATPIHDLVFNIALANEYRRLFDTCQLRHDREAEVAWTIRQLSKPAHKRAYKEVESKTGVPWFVIAILHYRECCMNFGSHLHNGDTLSARTKQIPSNRPKVWLPPCDWASSAIDALHEGRMAARFGEARDWSLELLLFRFEIYNGAGYRWRGVNTPYVWGFSNHYTKGLFYPDRQWNPDRASKQCGAAVILKAMVEKGLIPELRKWQPA